MKYPLGHDDKKYYEDLFSVLILLLMEYPLGLNDIDFNADVDELVLILLLLEYPLGATIEGQSLGLSRLNPSFAGIPARARKGDIESTCRGR